MIRRQKSIRRRQENHKEKEGNPFFRHRAPYADTRSVTSGPSPVSYGRFAADN